MILLVTGAVGSRECAAHLAEVISERVVLVNGPADCQKLLASGEPALDAVPLVVMDEGFLESSPALADALLARASGATAVFINLAISSCQRLVREVRLAPYESHSLAEYDARAAEDSLRGQISNHLTGILLNCQLALRSALPAEAAGKLREIQRLTGEVKSRLERAGNAPPTKSGRTARKSA